MILEPTRRSRTFKNAAAMSGALPSLQSAHDMAASSAVAGAQGRGRARSRKEHLGDGYILSGERPKALAIA